MARGQRQAALAVGLTLAQSYRYVLLPMAYRIVLPPLTSEFLNTIKNTSVALTIGLLELTSRARAMQEFSFQVFEAFAVATVMYLVLNLIVVVAMRRLERSVAVPALLPARGRAAAMFTDFDFEVIWRSLPYLFFDGMVFTLRLTLLAAAGWHRPGTLIAMMRLSRFAALSAVAAGYVNLLRSLPLVLVIFWFYFLIPWVWQWVTGLPIRHRSAPSCRC